jgi:nicotinate-nucleotide pyrophosphorylase (carboxylating)
MKSYLKYKEIKPIILLALKEDIGDGDITTNAVFNGGDKSVAEIAAKERGVFCGGDVAKLVYEEIDPSVRVSVFKKDGSGINPDDRLLKIEGHTKSVLSGERVVLNFMGRMCGIATRTRELSQLLKGTSIKLLDTRKTMPGFRLLDKYSVKTGGGQNHRMGLYDMILIKDNHIKAAGSISDAVQKVKNAYGKKYKIEVETTNLAEVEEAVSRDVDIIMLDNMDKVTMAEAVKIIKRRAKIEVSGNITEARIKEIKDLKIDFISTGSITHSVRSIDLSMRFL